MNEEEIEPVEKGADAVSLPPPLLDAWRPKKTI
jgi:hypothetical protein